MPPDPDPQPSGATPFTAPNDAAATGGRPGDPTGASRIPDAEALLALERQARQEGTGLSAADLEGLWWLERVWPRGQRQPSPLAGPLLRSLGASLRIEVIAAIATSEAPAPINLWLTNAVRLGPLQLRFQGPGWLQGKRPLLLFQFDRLEIRAGARLLLGRSLPAPKPRRQPFFALIARGYGSGWLAARGRSGGLALWRLGLESGPGSPQRP